MGRELRHTVGTRFWGSRGGWDYNSEATLQLGAFGDGRLRAWGTAHDTGYTFRSARFQPRVGLTAAVASGDSGNPNAPLGTFSPLPTGALYYGQGVNLNRPSNIIQIDPRLVCRLRSRSRSFLITISFGGQALTTAFMDYPSTYWSQGKETPNATWEPNHQWRPTGRSTAIYRCPPPMTISSPARSDGTDA